MTQEVLDIPQDRALRVNRVIGRVRGERPGATLLCVGGLHGNEPAGVLALQTVLEKLRSRGAEMHGEFVALAGNVDALAAGRRYMDRDLNRAWTEVRLARLRAEGHLNGLVEDREQVELLDVIEDVVETSRGPVFVLDLHTTSGPGGAFTTFGDTLPNRDFASHIPVPMILGLEELVDGTLLAFLGRHGLVGVAYESGRHYEDRAVDRAEAGIWLAMGAIGLLKDGHLAEATEARKLLRRGTQGLPRAMEMTAKHVIEDDDGFRMDPGWENFSHVRQGQAVAQDRRGSILAQESGRILMPLYQEQGEDGFFIVREFSRFWLHTSYFLRRLHTHRIAHWLPGVSRDPDQPDALIVNKHVARWFALQLFHLLGYRKHEDAGDRLVMRRRQYDEVRLVRKGPRPEHLR